MTDAQKIEEGAIIDAKGDFEALNEWLEELKEKIKDYEVKHPGRIYSGVALFSFGYFLGLRSDRRISWILQAISGFVFGYSAFQAFGQAAREKRVGEGEVKKEKEEEKKLKNVKLIKDEQN